MTGGDHRVYGPPNTFIGGNNEIALAMLMVVPLMNYLRATVANRWVSLAMGASMVLTMIAAIGSQSRGALLAFLAMLGFLWLKSRHKLLTALFGLVFVASVFAFMPAEWHQRMQTITEYQQDPSAMGRINAWYASVNIAASHLTGGGFDVLIAEPTRIFSQYAPNPSNWADAHSIYFEILAEHGFIGLFLFLMLFTMAFFTGSWIIRSTRDRPELFEYTQMARMVQVSLVAYAAGGAFLGLAYFDLPYHLVLLLVLARRCVEARLPQPREEMAAVHGQLGHGVSP